MTLNEKYDLINQDIIKLNLTDPLKIIEHIMTKNYISMHGPEHHYLDGAALLIAWYNADPSFDIHEALSQLAKRSVNMPGAMCGQWGICGSSASIGAALSVIHQTGPLSQHDFYKDHMALTSQIIAEEGKIGGPRCCKRNAYIALTNAVTFIKDKYDIHLKMHPIACQFSHQNSQCLLQHCPFYPKKEQSQ